MKPNRRQFSLQYRRLGIPPMLIQFQDTGRFHSLRLWN